ncbi:MAG: IgGFc-binding protein [Myxococcota bacterium]
MRWLLSSSLVALGVTGCADPCADDGLIQDDATDCPAVSGGGDSESDTEGETESESESETVTESESLSEGETDSGGGSTCVDGQQNGDETDVDCGGSCDEKCDDGEGCMVDDDCMSDACGDDGTCDPSGDTDSDPACDDGEQNGDETDVDCGNSCGPTCDDGEGCDDAADCVSGVCDEDGMTCTAPTCDDGVQNGDEDGVDCGGSCPDDCEPVSYCVDADEDGFGDPEDCVDVPPGEDPPDGSVPNGDDCADDNNNAFPGAAEEEPELCALDEDDDGYGDDDPPKGIDPGTDCLDTNPDAAPGAAENKGDACVIDVDGDGYGDANPPEGVDPGTDCVDSQAGIFPGAAEMEPELCTADGDDDGYGDDSATDIDPGADNGTDCADDNPNAFPGSAPNDSPTACLEDEDGDDYGDADPPDGVEPGTDCNDMDVTVPFVVEGIPEDCATAELLDGSLGCEFYGVPLSNDADPNNPPIYQLLLANANPTSAANVTVEEYQVGGWVTIFGPQAIAPETQLIQNFAHNSSSTTAYVNAGAYRITSDIPIASYQASISQFTSDASLLIPRASWDVEYDVVGYDGIQAGFDESFVVVSAEDGTEVTVTAGAATVAGPGLAALNEGDSLTFTLDEGDTAVFMSTGSNQTSAEGLSGSTVVADSPVGVFTANECTNIPNGAQFCDHLEEMQTPTNTASSTVVASRMPPRSTTPEIATWQIYAIEDATVSFDALPGVTGLPAGDVTLAAGESIELNVTGSVEEPGDFVIEGDAPLIVSQYLTGSTNVTDVIAGSASGDPAHVIMPGASQLLEAYVVGTVSGNVINHLTVTRQIGSADIELDDVAIPAADFSAVSAEWEVARIAVAEGTHVLTSDDAFSVLVSGYNQDNSYAYLGGGQARALVCE